MCLRSMSRQVHNKQSINNSLNGKSLESVIGKSHVEDYTLSCNVSWEIDVVGKNKTSERSGACKLSSNV